MKKRRKLEKDSVKIEKFSILGPKLGYLCNSWEKGLFHLPLHKQQIIKELFL